jgi:hypothetical protein
MASRSGNDAMIFKAFPMHNFKLNLKVARLNFGLKIYDPGEAQ